MNYRSFALTGYLETKQRSILLFVDLDVKPKLGKVNTFNSYLATLLSKYRSELHLISIYRSKTLRTVGRRPLINVLKLPSLRKNLQASDNPDLLLFRLYHSLWMPGYLCLAEDVACMATFRASQYDGWLELIGWTILYLNPGNRR